MSNTDCDSTVPVCKMPDHVCVECKEDSQCPGERPFCDVDVNICKGT